MPRSSSIGIGRSTSPTASGNSQRNVKATGDFYENLFRDTDYWDLYQSIVHSYSTPPPSSWFGYLDGSNQQNAYQHEMAMNDELSALAEKMYNETYQSPASDASRQRAAGFNPDLLGLSGQSAYEMSPDGVTSGAMASNPLAQIQGAAGIVLNAFSLGKGIAESILSFRGMKLDNLDRLTSIGNKLAGFVNPLSVYHPAGDESVSPAIAQYQEIDFLLSSLNFSRSSRKQLSRYLKSIVNHPSFKEGYYNNLRGYSVARQEYFNNTSGGHWNEDDSTMQILSKGLSDIIRLSQETNLNRGISDDIEQLYYNNIFDSSGAANADNAVNFERGDSAHFQTKLNSTLRKMIDSLSNAADRGDNLARGIQLALQFLLLNRL